MPIGIELHGRHPKSAVSEFLQRYARRFLKSVDCNYETEQGEEGFRTKLYVPVWSDQIFQGQWCDSLKAAEISAARCFVEDPEVVATASTLPALRRAESCDWKWGSSSSQWGDCNWSWNSDSTWNNWNSDWKSGSKRKRPTIAESTGMELHGRHPKTATREFLQRYAGRDLTLDDCNYETEQGEEGFRTKLYVPVWSDQIFQGQWCDSLKEAEVSAARCFVEDPEVVATASTLPASKRAVKLRQKRCHK